MEQPQKTNDEKILMLLEEVSKYGRTIQNTEIIVQECPPPDVDYLAWEFKNSRNALARAIFFQYHLSDWLKFVKGCHDTWTLEEEVEGIKILENMLNFINMNVETMSLFWEGRQPIDPRKMPFRSPSGDFSTIDINEVKSMRIPYLGFK